MSISAEKFSTKVHISKGKKCPVCYHWICIDSYDAVISSHAVYPCGIPWTTLYISACPTVALSMVYYTCDIFGAFCWERGIPDWTPEDYNWLSTGWLGQYLYFLVPQGKIHPSGTALRKESQKVTKAEAVPWRCSTTLELHQEQDFFCWLSYTGTGGFGIRV